MTVTVAGTDDTAPAVATYWNVTGPVTFLPGVYVTDAVHTRGDRPEQPDGVTTPTDPVAGIDKIDIVVSWPLTSDPDSEITTGSSSTPSTPTGSATGAVPCTVNPPNDVAGETRFVLDPTRATKDRSGPTSDDAVAPSQRPNTTLDADGTTAPDTNLPDDESSEPDNDENLTDGVNVPVVRFRPHTTTV